ncbi:MAG TPA: ATP-binding cassette domain-containing protein, partial [Baekduia sp.]|nr:ATP-binding cassette domain-containing protein [Baekduia sp.]
DQADAAASGQLSLTEAVIHGAVEYDGPVRRYLVVEPIIRRVLADLAGHGAEKPLQRSPGSLVDRGVPSDLLAIETRNVSKSFGPNQVLRGLDIGIPEGTISVVLGPSGTGKSVLLQHIIGVMRPDAGDVLIRGRPLSQMSRGEILGLRRGIGVMFQDGALFSAMNVFDNVAFPLRQHTNLGDAEVREVVEEHLASVGLADAGDRMPSQLSGGMRKRAGLARALVLNPSIILCDEPDSGLDPVRTALLGDLLVEQHAEHGGTMVVVTHNVMLAKRIADHMSVLWRGEVLESGMASEILESETPFIQQFLAGTAQGPLGMDA